MDNPKVCEYCKAPIPIEYGECTCLASFYENMSDADRAADAEYQAYIQGAYDDDEPTEADYWDGDETDRIQY